MLTGDITSCRAGREADSRFSLPSFRGNAARFPIIQFFPETLRVTTYIAHRGTRGLPRKHPLERVVTFSFFPCPLALSTR